MNTTTPYQNMLDPSRVQEVVDTISNRETLRNMRRKGWRWKVAEKGPIPQDLIDKEKKRIAEHRVVLEMRKAGKLPTRGQRYARTMPRWYITRLIEARVEHDGHEITDEEVRKFRERLESFRKGEIKHPNAHPKKTEQEKKDTRKKSLQEGIDKLADWYVKNLIRKRIGTGKKITKKMVDDEREKLQKMREDISMWPKGTRGYEKLSDGYIIALMRSSPGYTTITPTKEVIERIRQGIIRKRKAREDRKSGIGVEKKPGKKIQFSPTILTDKDLNELLNAFI